jgi:CheY-like chemotaxis protein
MSTTHTAPIASSRPVILILEDDVKRLEKFAETFHNTGYTIYMTDEVHQCIEILQKHKVDLAYLDHDLGGKVMVDPDKEPTGYHVAKWLEQNPDRAPRLVFVHSLNPQGSKSMATALRTIHNTTTVIAPFPSCITQYRVSQQ